MYVCRYVGWFYAKSGRQVWLMFIQKFVLQLRWEMEIWH